MIRGSRRCTLPLLLLVPGLLACPPRESGPQHADVVRPDAGSTVIAPASWPAKIRLGLNPVLDRASLVAGYTPFVVELGRLLGTEVELVVSQSYGELGELLERGEVQFGQMSPLAYVVARQRLPGLRLLASQIAEGGASYSAYIVAGVDSDIFRAEDLRGRVMGFVDRSSASGYLYPLVHIWDRFGQPERFFSSVRFTGNHQALLRAVASGELDAGATFSAALVNYGNMGLGSPFRVVAKTGRIPYDAFVAGPELDEAQCAALRAALLGLDTRSARGRRVLGPLRLINGFLPGDDSLYDPVRKVLERAMLHGMQVGAEPGGEDAGP